MNSKRVKKELILAKALFFGMFTFFESREYNHLKDTNYCILGAREFDVFVRLF